MRIPDAYFSGGLGQRVTPAAPISSAGAEQVAGAARRLGDTVAGIGLDIIRERGNQELSEALERKAETDRLEKIKADSAARSSLFRHETEIASLAESIGRDSSLDHQQRRDRFRQESGKVRAAFETSVPEEYRYAFAPAFDEHIFKAEGAMDKHLQQELRDEIRASGAEAREALINSARPLADKLALLKDPDAFDWEGEGYGEDDRQKIVTQLAEEATGAEIEERFNSGDPRQVLADLRATSGEGGDYSHYGDLAPKTRQAYIRTAKSLIEQQDREAERRKKEEKDQRVLLAREAFEQYKELREGLFPIDPKQEAGFWQLVAGTEYEDKAKGVRKTTGALGFVAGKVKEDPLRYGAAQLGLDVPQLSLDDPASWQQQLQAREQVAGAIREAHGLTYLPILTNDEATGLSGIFQTQTPQAQVRTVAGLSRGLGKETMQQVARQFAAQDADLGMLVGLAASGKEKAAYHVADGRRLMGEKAAPMTPVLKTDLRTRFEDQMEGALSGLPQMREGFFRAVTAAYVSLTAAGGVPDPDRLDKKAFDSALEMVVGSAPVSINGKAVLVPDGMTEEQFKTNWRRIGADQVKNAGGVLGFSSDAEAAEAIRDDAEPWEAGAGRYRFAIDGRFLLTADGRPLELALNDMAGLKIPVGK